MVKVSRPNSCEVVVRFSRSFETRSLIPVLAANRASPCSRYAEAETVRRLDTCHLTPHWVKSGLHEFSQESCATTSSRKGVRMVL